MNPPDSIVDTSTCDKEPIHIPGTIQPHGVLFTLNDALEIECSSQNTDTLLQIHPKELIGKPIHTLFGPSERNRRIGLLTELSNDRKTSFSLCPTLRGVPTHLYAQAHRFNGRTLLEIEPLGEDAISAATHTFLLHEAIERIHAARDLKEMCQVAAHEVQRISGYDRVMIYRFDAQWNGQVIAEHLSNPKVDSYADLWFPASDIPQQARAMFTKNWLRMIPDVDFDPSPILAPDPRTVDLSLSMLRTPSPLHIEYLKNMGVGATLTISLLHEGVLWGLIACHHNSPKWLNHEKRASCEFIGKLVSSLIACKQLYDDQDYRLALKRTNEDLVHYMQDEEDFVRGLVKHSPNLLDVTSSSGAAAAVYFEGKWTVIGRVPQLHEINSLVKWLRPRVAEQGLYATNCLSKEYPEARAYKHVAAGVIAISIPKSADNYVLWFRPEVAQTVTWAGNPAKAAVVEDDGVQLHPRKSFNLWKQAVADTAIPWKPAELEAAAELRRSIIEIDLARQFKREQQARTEATLDKKRVEFLSEVSKALAYTLDYSVTLANVARLSVRGFCDWCVIYLFENGALRRAAIAHATPEGQAIAEELYGLPTPSPHGLNVLAKVFTTGESELVTRVDRDWLRGYAKDATEYHFISQRLGIESYLSAALVSRGKRLGIIEFATCESKRYFTEEDRGLAEELCRRAAVAIDNAQLFREVKTQFESAERANRVKEEVLAIVSHDLKNPVRSILFSTELIKRALSTATSTYPAAVDVSTRNITTSANQMKHLIEDLLDITKIESQTSLALEKVPFSVGALINEVLAILGPLAQDKEICIEPSIEHPDDFLTCDPRRIQQVLSNLIGNAIKFTDRGGRIDISGYKQNDSYLFAIRDTGIGIPEEQLPNVFDRFWQGRTNGKDGLGLGLAIARGIVQAHGGEILATSQLGRGSTFQFSIPTR